jgi:hypothetical protein
MINRNVGLGDKFSGGRTGFIVFKGKTVVGVVVGAVVGGAVAVIVGIGIGVRSAQIVVGRVTRVLAISAPWQLVY